MQKASAKVSQANRQPASALFLGIVLLTLLIAGSACNQSARPDASTPNSSAAAAPDESKALVGQWRNVNGTWRFQANGTFWYMGGTTIQVNPSAVTVPTTESLAGTYQVHGTNLHLTLKQHTPGEQDSIFQIDGRKLTIDGVEYEQQ